MTTDQWLKIDSDKYSSIEEQLTQLHEKSFDVYHEYDNSKGRTLPEMNLEWGSFTKHLNIMKTVIDRYYDDATFKSLLPPGTTKEFLYLLVDFHDLGRICNMNALSELVMTDNVSHHLLKTIAPNFPQEQFLPDVDQIAGYEKMPGEEDFPILYFFKLLDTCCKDPARHPDDLEREGSAYSKWYANAIKTGALPITRPKPVAAETYRENDIDFVKRAYTLINKIIPGINFDTVLDEAVAAVQ
jgi:hypothetical protein